MRYYWDERQSHETGEVFEAHGCTTTLERKATHLQPQQLHRGVHRPFQTDMCDEARAWNCAAEKEAQLQIDVGRF